MEAISVFEKMNQFELRRNELFYSHAGQALIYGQSLTWAFRVQPADGGAVICAALGGLWEAAGVKEFIEEANGSFWRKAKMVMRRRVVDWLRQNGREKRNTSLEGLLENGWERAGRNREKERAEAVETVEDCLAQIRDDVMRKVLWQIGRGFSEKAVAKRLCMSKSAVSRIFQRGVEQIRKSNGLPQRLKRRRVLKGVSR